MSRIYWDSMLFMYWFENHPNYAPQVDRIHRRMRERGDELVSSAFVLGEILVGLHGQGVDAAGIQQMKDSFATLVSTVSAFDHAVADVYGRIRSSLRVSPADSIHLACAAHMGTDLFVTNDKRLHGKIVPGIQFIASLENVPI
jgi:predicted nucleic acid-binding protein